MFKMSEKQMRRARSHSLPSHREDFTSSEVSLKRASSKEDMINFNKSSSPRMEKMRKLMKKEKSRRQEELLHSPPPRCSGEDFTSSDVSLKSDQSKEEIISLKKSSSPRPSQKLKNDRSERRSSARERPLCLTMLLFFGMISVALLYVLHSRMEELTEEFEELMKREEFKELIKTEKFDPLSMFWIKQQALHYSLHSHREDSPSSDVSLKSDQSKEEITDFKESSSASTDFMSFPEEDISPADDEQDKEL